MFSNKTKKKSKVSLHDCTAAQIDLRQGRISFDFPNGFSVGGEQTGASRMTLQFSPQGQPFCYVFKQKTDVKAVRKEWTAKKLAKKVNGGCTLEFISCYEYLCGKTSFRIYECTLHLNKSPWHKECQIRVAADKELYQW